MTSLQQISEIFPGTEAFLRSVLEAAPAFIMTITPDGGLMFLNRLAEGFSDEDVRGASVFDFTEAASHSNVRACIDRVLRSHAPDTYECIGMGAQRELRHYETKVAPIVRDGQVVALTLVATDVTDQRRVDGELRESEERLRLAVGATGLGLWSWEPEADLITWDDRLLAIAGRAPGDAPRTIADYAAIVHPDDRRALAGRAERARAEGETEVSEYRLVRPDGEVRWVQVFGKAVRDDGGRVLKLVGGTLDVTERRAVEERLRQSQKLEAVGQLTAGIAHNFNNLLMAILPNLELVARQRGGELAPMLDEARHAAERAAELVRQLLLFTGARGGRTRRAENIATIVERTVSMCRSTFDRRIVLDVRTVGPLPLVKIDAGELEQVVLNVCLNARDALVGRPRPLVRVTLDALPPEAKEITSRAGAAPCPHVRVSIEDTGAGMDEPTRRRVFEPFFTTKPVGKGTGLGLATAYGIVAAHGGWMAVGSTLGVGTAVSIFLPASDEEAPVPPRPRPAGAIRGGGERILLVDDEAGVRQVVTHVLAEAGYDVVPAAGAREAMEVFAASPEGFALVILDVSMPDGSGRDVCRRMQELRPSQRVVYFSGNLLEDVPEASGVVLKPVGADELLAEVRAVLDRA